MGIRNKRKLSILMCFIVLILTGCNIQLYEPVEPTVKVEPVEVDAPIVEMPKNEPFVYSPIVINSALKNADTIKAMMNVMTLEEKVAQLFIVDFYGMTATYHEKKYDKSMDEFLRKYPVGGIVFFSENIESRDQVLLMTTALKEVSQIPLFISVDEEGGVVSRLGKANIGVTHLEDAIKLSAEKTPEEVNALAATLGEEIKALGFNMNFAPVLDIHTNPDNPVIGKRAFGVDAASVTTYANAFNKGLMASGIITSGKHFPGHGDTATDSHTEQTSVTHTAKRLKSTELVPFKQAIKDGIPTIMMGHITLPNVSENPLPATLSPDIIQTILRKDLGFKGVVVTDSLRMKAITDFYTAAEVGVLFLQAGGDMILIPDDFEATYQGIINAVNEGKISTARINESVERILNVKVQYGLLFKQED